jgi:hypothetical protein
MSRRKLGIGALGMALALPLALHAPTTTGTKVNAKLKTGTTMQLTGTIDGIPITVTCKSFTASGTAPATGAINVTLPEPPKMSSCTDSFNGTDTIVTNQTNGKWTLKEVTSGTTKKLDLTMPKAGATFSSSLVSGCDVTASPSASTIIAGAFKPGTKKDSGTDTVTNAPVPVSGSGCTATSSTISATVVLTPVAS